MILPGSEPHHGGHMQGDSLRQTSLALGISSMKMLAASLILCGMLPCYLTVRLMCVVMSGLPQGSLARIEQLASKGDFLDSDSATWGMMAA